MTHVTVLRRIEPVNALNRVQISSVLWEVFEHPESESWLPAIIIFAQVWDSGKLLERLLHFKLEITQ